MNIFESNTMNYVVLHIEILLYIIRNKYTDDTT